MEPQQFNDAHGPKLIVLLGCDGCGKSSCLQRLEQNGYMTSAWQMLADVPELNFCRTAAHSPGQYREALPALSRAVFVASAIFYEYDFIIAPALRRGKTVIVDSYYLRPLAKEIVKGRANRQILDIVKLLPAPDEVILFDVDLTIAYTRKDTISINEVTQDTTLADFVSFQRQVLDTAVGLVSPGTMHHVNAGLPAEQVFDGVLDIVRRLDGYAKSETAL